MNRGVFLDFPEDEFLQTEFPQHNIHLLWHISRNILKVIKSVSASPHQLNQAHFPHAKR